MTVADLIAKLGEFPQDMLVVVSGFDESGYDPLDTIEVVRIEQLRLGASHSGRYRDVDAGGAEPIGPPFDALHLDF